MKLKLIAAALFLLSTSPAQAEWTSLSAGLPESDVRWAVVDPADSKTLYAATARQVYRSTDAGSSWQQVCTVWGDRDVVRFLYADPSVPGTAYAASDSGVWRTEDRGDSWKPFYQGVGGRAKSVRCLARDAADPKKLWIGTSQGLVSADGATGRAAKVASFPSLPVMALWVGAAKTQEIHAAVVDGLYVSRDGGAHWAKIAHAATPEDESDALEQLGAEELPLATMSASIIHEPSLGKFFAATPSGLYDTSDKDASWRRIGGRSTQGLKINYIARTPDTFYAATNRGVYRWDPELSVFQDLSEGLPTRSISMVTYDAFSGGLIAATKKGVYRRAIPALPDGVKPAPAAAPNAAAEQVLRAFDAEPSVRDIQKAAIEYAEVHPRKIRQWREAAARKAWLPTVSFNQGFDTSQNIDLDRGGTGDPDKFIEGPAEKGYDWSVTTSWNLGEIVWNDDQTSIDTRSKLLVELRNDVLSEVTHLYFERRRLQAELALRPPANPATLIEKRLRLDELTASIDALTGGYLTARLLEISSKFSSR